MKPYTIYYDHNPNHLPLNGALVPDAVCYYYGGQDEACEGRLAQCVGRPYEQNGFYRFYLCLKHIKGNKLGERERRTNPDVLVVKGATTC